MVPSLISVGVTLLKCKTNPLLQIRKVYCYYCFSSSQIWNERKQNGRYCCYIEMLWDSGVVDKQNHLTLIPSSPRPRGLWTWPIISTSEHDCPTELKKRKLCLYNILIASSSNDTRTCLPFHCDVITKTFLSQLTCIQFVYILTSYPQPQFQNKSPICCPRWLLKQTVNVISCHVCNKCTIWPSHATFTSFKNSN